MNLEDFRRDTLGVLLAWIPARGADDSAMIPLSYPEYAMGAFYYSCQSLEDLEKSHAVINPSVRSTTAIAYWFLAIEAFVSANLKIACGLTDADYNEFRGRDLGSRVRALGEILKIDLRDYYKAGLFTRLQDFMAFRNELFHDRFNDTQRDYKHTSFSPFAHLLNQVDVVQAAVIALESFIAFGQLYEGVDLMPNLKVEKADSFGWFRYDKLHGEMLIPFFESVLQKHELSSSVERRPAVHRLPITPLAARGAVRICIRAIQDERFEFKPNPQQSDIATELLTTLRKQIEVDPDKFPLPNYHRE